MKKSLWMPGDTPKPSPTMNCVHHSLRIRTRARSQAHTLSGVLTRPCSSVDENPRSYHRHPKLGVHVGRSANGSINPHTGVESSPSLCGNVEQIQHRLCCRKHEPHVSLKQTCITKNRHGASKQSCASLSTDNAHSPAFPVSRFVPPQRKTMSRKETMRPCSLEPGLTSSTGLKPTGRHGLNFSAPVTLAVDNSNSTKSSIEAADDDACFAVLHAADDGG
jgi:hypothetical protein